ncbi:MAG: ornithine decarboxylase, partial [Eubacteriales bacterium]|nr:ornithine decarboxylase [Eubacteriales bacterium]
IPATILANYLRENRFIPEKCDFNSILFLMTPAETKFKMRDLVRKMENFETEIKKDALLSEVLPSLYKNNKDRYEGYTIKQLCQEMHDFYKNSDAKKYQKELFRQECFPEAVLAPHQAHWELVRNNAKLVCLDDIVGEIALEGALPYPPGIYCVVPGEKWNETAQKYFKILEDGINKFPGFAPEIQGLYLEKENGVTKSYGYVLDKAIK